MIYNNCTLRIMFVFFTTILLIRAKEIQLIPVETSITSALEIYTVEKPKSDNSNIYHIVKTNNKLLFCDDNMTFVKEREIVPDGRTNIHPSKLNRYFLLEEFVSLAEYKFEVGLRRYTLIDNRNNQYHVKEEPLVYDYFTTKKTVISDIDGTMYELETSTAEFTIRSRNGNEIKRIKLYEDFKYWYSGLNGYIDISADGSTVVVNMNRTNFVPERKTKPRIPLRGKDAGKEIPRKFIEGQSGEPHLFLFDNTGKLLWKQALTNETAMGLSVTDKVEYIFASSHTNHPDRGIRETVTTIYDVSGNSLHKFSFLFGKYCLKDDLLVVEDRTILTGNYIRAIELQTGEEKWKQSFDERNLDIINADINGNIIVVTSDWLHPEMTYHRKLRVINSIDGLLKQKVDLGLMRGRMSNFHSLEYFPQTSKGQLYKTGMKKQKRSIY